MADAAARREARRKRILENSENRLQRITGSNIGAREDKLSNAFTPSIAEPIILENEIAADTKACPDQQESESQNETFDKTYLEERDFLNDLRKRSNRDVNHEVDHDIRNERFSLNNERRQNTTVNKVTNESEKDVNTHDSVRRLSTQSSLSLSIFSSKWILVILAAFVNILYISQLQHLCGKTILAPFFALMLVRLHLGDSKSEAQGGSILSAALILCNIKPELVHNLRRVIKTVKKITEELSIYIFSFVIFYNIASSYWSDVDITLSSIDSDNDGEFQ